jgi:MFS family permease
LSSAAPPHAPSPPRNPVIGRAFAAFHYRDFRVLWFGAFSSTVGNWMQQVAQSWLVFDLTHSSFYLGLDYFCGQLPILLLTLIGGVVADRHDRRHVLLGSQLVQMSTAFTLAALLYLNLVRVQYILLLSFVAGLGQAFGGPAYQALIPSLVQKKDLPNAIALNSIQFNLARVFGPLLAGATLAAFGSAACFGLNGLSFFVVILALLSMNIKHVKPADPKPMLQELKGGLRYAKGEPTIVALTILAALTTFLGLPLLTFLPVFARDIFQGDVNRFSHMMAFSGAGAVCGALVVAWLGRFKHMGRTLLMTQVAFGALITAFALSRILWLSNALLFFSGAALLMTFSMTSSLVQLIVPDHLRGRVMSIYMVAFRGGMPLGSLAAGYVASVTSAPLVLQVNGLLIMCVAAYFLIRSHGVREL